MYLLSPQVAVVSAPEAQAVNPRAGVERERVGARDGKGGREEVVGCAWAQAARPLPPALPAPLPACASAAGEPAARGCGAGPSAVRMLGLRRHFN